MLRLNSFSFQVGVILFKPVHMCTCGAYVYVRYICVRVVHMCNSISLMLIHIDI